jgi:large subunit ribosomal protein L10
MARALKEMLIAGYEADLAGASNVIVVDPGSMSVEKSQALRKDLREKAGGARLRVIHNRTAARALGGLYRGKEKALEEVLTGPSAILFGGEGLGPIAKVLRDWKKKHKPLKVKGGVADGDVLDGRSVEALADLPGLPQLRAMLASAILGPGRAIAVAMKGAPGAIARGIHQRVEKGGGAPPEAGVPPEAGAPDAPAS